MSVCLSLPNVRFGLVHDDRRLHEVQGVRRCQLLGFASLSWGFEEYVKRQVTTAFPDEVLWDELFANS